VSEDFGSMTDLLRHHEAIKTEVGYLGERIHLYEQALRTIRNYMDSPSAAQFGIGIELVQVIIGTIDAALAAHASAVRGTGGGERIRALSAKVEGYRPELGRGAVDNTEPLPSDLLHPDPDAIAQAARDFWNGLSDEQRGAMQEAWQRTPILPAIDWKLKVEGAREERAADERDRLRAQVEELAIAMESQAMERQHWERKAAERATILVEQARRIAELEEALRKYGTHRGAADECHAQPCGCGLDDALASTRGEG
jgi:hypothetical protein